MHRQPKAVALLLSLAYSIIAVAGHGLHALAPCGDAACQQAAVTCECCCHPTNAAADTQHDSSSPELWAADNCQSHTCAICALLAQVKVGHGSATTQVLATAVVQPAAVKPQLAAIGILSAAHSPRGPPATS